jgi:hypothetical protein
MKKYYAEIYRGEERILSLSSWDKEELELKAAAAFKRLLPKGTSRFSDRTLKGGHREITAANLRLVIYR